MGRSSDLYSAYERKLAEVLAPLTVAAARARCLDVSGWWLWRQQFTRQQLVAHGLVPERTSWRRELYAQQLLGKPVDQVTPEEMAEWVHALGTAPHRGLR
jgi:hypothetical protein